MLYNLVDRLQNALADWGLLWLVQVVFQLEFRAFAATLLAFVAVLVSGPPAIRRLVGLQVGDVAEFHHEGVNALMKAKAQTPTMGGVFLCGSMLLSILLLADLSNRFVQLSVALVLWLCILGAFDDYLKTTAARRGPGSRDGLFAWEKLLFQIGIGVLVAYSLQRELAVRAPEMLSLNLPFQRTFEPTAVSETLLQAPQVSSWLLGIPPWAFVVGGTLWIAFCSNAVNISDGMDGLAGGTTLIASIALMVLCFIAGSSRAAYFLLVPYVPGSAELMVVAGAMAGACLGFLWFNCKPAKVFMGDTGSLPLGGLLGFIALAIRQEFLLILVGAVFFLEIASVMMQVGWFKWTGGRRIFRCAPIHHHFHLGGWSEQQVVTRFWVITVVMTMLAFASIKLR
ncbi:MAG: phospho-N-acetylmuramoyl-pentapeptide-transferase [Planctomycetota bacterium]|jgi:phospho-N-acetylmuramoyl-pentapeptide-transferase